MHTHIHIQCIENNPVNVEGIVKQLFTLPSALPTCLQAGTAWPFAEVAAVLCVAGCWGCFHEHQGACFANTLNLRWVCCTHLQE